MTLPLAVSSATWDLLERLRPNLDAVIDVFDTSMMPLLVPCPTAAAGHVRAALAHDGPETPREHLRLAIAGGHYAVTHADGVRFAFFPLRSHGRVVGALMTAVADATTDTRKAASDHDARAERHLDRLGWTLRAMLESDIVVWSRLEQAEQRARWAESVPRFLDYLQRCDDEAAIFTALVQSAAFWSDRESYVFTRTLDRRFVLEAALPSATSPEAPAQFDAATTEGRTTPFRLSSIAELEQMGWRGGVREISAYPLSVSGEDAAHLFIVVGAIEERFDQAFRTLARAVGSRLTDLVVSRVHQICDRLRAIAAHGTHPQQTANALLDVVRAALPASHIRLIVEAAAEGMPAFALASEVGASDESEVPQEWAVVRESHRLAYLIALSGGTAHLTMQASPGVAFSLTDAALAAAAAARIGLWLGGACAGRSVRRPAAGATDGFERRLAEEVERSRRFNLRAGLLVIDAVSGDDGRAALTSEPLVSAVREQLRASDVVGRLEDGRLAALLVHTDDVGVGAVASRVERHLARPPVARADTPSLVLGAAAFPVAGDSGRRLLDAAQQDLERRGSALGRPGRSPDERTADAARLPAEH